MLVASFGDQITALIVCRPFAMFCWYGLECSDLTGPAVEETFGSRLIGGDLVLLGALLVEVSRRFLEMSFDFG